MDALTDIGEMVISTRDDDFFLRPSFIALTRIGSPEEIVEAYSIINGRDFGVLVRAAELQGVPSPWLVESVSGTASRRMLNAAMTVIQACCDRDATTLVGELADDLTRQHGLIPDTDMLIIARELLEHGVMGKAPLRKLQKHENQQTYTAGFRAVEYITAARSHFGLPRAEAEQLTMTAFQLMLKAKYPEEKGFTRDEYEDIMAAHEQRKMQKLEAMKA